MRITRRTLFAGAGTGAVALLLASCTGEPEPAPTTSAPTTPPSPRPSPSNGIPLAAAAMRSGWATDSASYGAVSYLPVGALPGQREALARSVDDRVFFAGEATDAARPASVAGAVSSGMRAADEVRAVAADGERIAVVGAGAAGATAARRLADAGFDVTVVEARARVGGRIHSAEDDSWPFPVQLGGWLLGDDDVDLGERLRALGVETIDLEGVRARDEAGQSDLAPDDTIRDAIDRAGELPSDVSLADALTEAGADLEDPALAASLAFLASAVGADADELSSWFPPELPVEPRTAVLGDLNALVERPLEELQVALSSPVVRIAHDDSGVSLRLGTGEAFSSDRVVVTVPLGVLQHGGIEFQPPLPFEHRTALSSLGMGQIETIWLRFDEKFWQPEAALWHVVGGDATVRTWINLHPETGENVLVGILGGGAAVDFAALDEEDAVAAALMSLGYFGEPAVGTAADADG